MAHASESEPSIAIMSGCEITDSVGHPVLMMAEDGQGGWMTEDQRDIRRKKRVLEYAEKIGNIKTTCHC
jgi:hypothetical protein